ncbi:hypothetical protein BGZ61DRAFT_541264 [Ilyonectria robusta]|uniref:uncharacterized protein n=1 Tax=Ilyonectria robusta TaxID=1079257 RepID=UPI001E8EB163|nr:uncharacterized protein BGZ61DRAFT_541264 [Ilyonectria robusta]KAH8654832.1 hypothetical protein BGZ61DRAFT_541264 [Ilyonectria robusta]
MASRPALQLMIIPHRPVPSDDEINRDLAPAFEILQKVAGLRAIWRGEKFEDRYTQVALLLWDNLAASHAFFTGPAYAEFHKAVQPAMNGRHVEWQNHVLIDTSGEDTLEHLRNVLESPAIEVALTKVVEGGVSGYYSQFKKFVTGVLHNDPGCDGFFISPLIENPQNQLLLINWKSVDAHHEIFEKTPGFKVCIDALKEYYAVFVVPWHITKLKLANGGL